MTDGTYGTQRKAAARNRTAIIEAAHELFAQNPLVPLSEVAKRAGVGAGTLYRHFPAREDLILAAYQHDIERLTTTADEVLARHSSAKAAFVEWFETLSAYIRIKHGLGDALHSAAAQELISASWAPTTAAVKKLVDACVAEGTIAAGHDPADIIMLMSFLWRVANNDEGAAQGRRLIAAVFTGLQTPPGE
ncbi:TetR/AcrR family transcriptional regulator [Amycolatopsis sp. A133]|jgi:AcrR family transcriptional regulator|uniref:TetR/AcrR family transcriptional regulator n=1 Tax=Amycolatopsis sp. A133 TaxID=3064472 RepID=UPI0027F8EFA6|nr:TetR/AcrR family transcriptional regulator [Amycolatopsis sp. A133]MDQ7804405.1 TetR/AcrR family transcriptional regulator [Amycolatopsis sp. A133]